MVVILTGYAIAVSHAFNFFFILAPYRTQFQNYLKVELKIINFTQSICRRVEFAENHAGHLDRFVKI